MTDLRREDLASPALYPLALDAAVERVLFVRLDEAAYRAASFLDEQILGDVGPGRWIVWGDLQAALPAAGPECDFIFHIGHVGSTLLSRLLDHSPQVFGLREPAVLRTLAQAELAGMGGEVLAERTAKFLRLWSRTWRAGQKTLLKATSFTAEIAPLLLRLQPSARAVLMFVQPSVYLATILAGEASRQELRINAPMRLARLHRRLGGKVWRLESFSEGETAAMSWACEMLALAGVAADFPGRGLRLDFETLLENPADQLVRCLEHLYGGAPDADVAAMVASQDLTRYSKAPEYAYDAVLRWRVLAQASREHGAEIRRGMDWLAAAAQSRAAVADAVRLATGAAGAR